MSAVLKEIIKWNERGMQDAIYIHCVLKSHELIVPNSKVCGWEADIISITKAGRIHEFEIKISRADFRADAKKYRAKWLVEPEFKSFGVDMVHPRPNYFYYAVPKDLITPDEVPEHAGLIYVNFETDGHRLFYGITSLVKPPTLLHKEAITDWQRHQLMRALTDRYWKQRLGKGSDRYYEE